MFLHTCPFSLDTYIKRMELSKPYKGKGKRRIKKMPFTVKGIFFILRLHFPLSGFDNSMIKNISILKKKGKYAKRTCPFF